MAHTTYTLETITVPSGTLTVKLNHGDGSLDTSGGPRISQIGPIRESIEFMSNTIELPTVDFAAVDIPNTLYPEGFWHYALSQSLSSYTENPEIELYLDEGSGNTFVFAGEVDLSTVEFEELGTATTDPKLVRFTCVSNYRRIEDVTWADFIDYLNTNRAEPEEGLASRPSISLALGGTATDDGVTYGYRLAARNAAGEYIWGSQETISGPAALNGSSYIRITWSAISGFFSRIRRIAPCATTQ